ncbi:cytochrome c biogenesis protein ResB [Rugamonas sp.]|uniref:cytochrome c biogenesis protein ResB n=1 Tax=Rugamonas sp. TaxID=1926287 RepID=UPI0025E2A2CA|nr:cytochrome c biogenesis protein ResB [Rugamonas sp.]
MKTVLNLLRSMRFAIAILTVVAVASTIGSVLEQSQPAVVYVSHYGEFWAAFFALCGLTEVYHAFWFFVLLAFMATSTLLCLWQNTPSMIRDIRSFRENKSLASLKNLPQHRQIDTGRGGELRPPLEGYLKSQGFRFKLVLTAESYLIAARSGSSRRVGYLLVHGAMVLICIGGLVDGNPILRYRLWAGTLRPETRDLAADQVPALSRLPADGGSYRASMNIPEGETMNTALLQIGDGYLQQPLPFSVRLKQFRIEHHPNGQPKDFASDIDIIDGDRTVPVSLHVNHPYTYKGVTLFQSGFADGGSKVALKISSISAASPTSDTTVGGAVGAGAALLLNGQPFTLEFTELRTLNVFPNEAVAAATWGSHSKPGDRFRNLGPSIAFRLRDQAGQAEEWNVYQHPVTMEGASYVLMGKRGPQQSALRYVHFPADGQGGLALYRHIARAINDPQARIRAARAVAANAADRQVAAALESTTAKLLTAFSQGGYRTLAAMVPASAGQQQQMKIGALYLDLLQRAIKVWAEEQPGMTAPGSHFEHDVLDAYNDALEAKMSFLIELASFEQHNATGLQVTHAPGALLVYLGSALLALGVITMYFVRERRMWIHVDTEKRSLLLAFSANRDGPALQGEFDLHAAEVEKIAAAPPSPHPMFTLS